MHAARRWWMALSYLGLQGDPLCRCSVALPVRYRVLAARTTPTGANAAYDLVLPLMSCSARLPVYALLLAALLPGSPWRAGLALGALYISSLLVGALTAGLISRLILRKGSRRSCNGVANLSQADVKPT